MQALQSDILRVAHLATIQGKPDPGRGNYRVNVAKSMTSAVGVSSTERVGLSKAVSVGTAFTLNVGASKMENVGDGSYETTGRGKFIHAGKCIDLRCGKARFLMREDGTIEIEGLHVKISADRIDLN